MTVFLRLCRVPLVHFLLLGAILFGWGRPWSAGSASKRLAPARAAIVITAARVGQLGEEFLRENGRPASVDEEQALLAREIETELLYREARVRGLDRGDPSIRWQLIEKMSFLQGLDESAADRDALFAQARAIGLEQDDPVIRRMLVAKLRLLVQTVATREPVDDAALQAYLGVHPDAFRSPPRYTLQQVFFSRNLRGDQAGDDARRTLARLAAAPAATPDGFGDASALPRMLHGRSAEQLATAFGEPFAAAVGELPPGTWAGPIASAHGLHLVRVEAVEPGGIPALATVANQVRAAVGAERAHDRMAAFVAALHRLYSVQIEAGGRSS